MAKAKLRQEVMELKRENATLKQETAQQRGVASQSAGGYVGGVALYHRTASSPAL